MKHMVTSILGLWVWAACAGASGKPNIIVVVIDDMGWNDIGYHNSEMVTPNLDRFAKEGISLDRFYVAPVCSPTRAGLLSGRYPIRYDMQSGVCSPTAKHGMPPSEFTVAEMLSKCGYRQRMFIGKWHLGHYTTIFHPLNQGFTSFYGHYNGAIDYFTHMRAGELDWHRDYDACHDEGYSTDLVGRTAVDFIRQNASSESPFLLWVAFNGVHSPVQAKEEDMKRFGFDPGQPRIKSDDAGLARREKYPEYGQQGRPNDLRQGFKALALAVDRAFGGIVDELEMQGIADNTLVLFASDNGGDPQHGGSSEPWRGGKFTTFEGGVRVPAAIRWPAGLEGGRKVEATLTYVDLLPTLAAVAGYEGSWPNELDGKNMLGILQGREKAADRYVYLGTHSGGAVANNRWKLVKDELFDLEADPFEKHDVAAQHPEQVAALREVRNQFEKLHGPAVVGTTEYDAFPPKEWKIAAEEGSGHPQTDKEK